MVADSMTAPSWSSQDDTIIQASIQNTSEATSCDIVSYYQSYSSLGSITSSAYSTPSSLMIYMGSIGIPILPNLRQCSNTDETVYNDGSDSDGIIGSFYDAVDEEGVKSSDQQCC